MSRRFAERRHPAELSRDQTEGRCVFCGGRGLTKGHIWPNWMNEALPHTATHHEQEIGKFHTFTPQVRLPEHKIIMRQGAAISRKPRNTCVRCNGGWMSSIESLSKHFTAALIGGHSTVLTPFLQLATSSLLCLIVMRPAFTTEQIAVPQQDRDWLRYYREPSANWKIWIARFAGVNAHEHWSRTYGLRLETNPTPAGEIEYCDVRVSTFVIGKLCAHIAYTTDPDATAGVEYDDVNLCRIWPPNIFDVETVMLPMLDGDAVLLLHEALARGGRPSPRLYGNL
jgi:hypothetical protein